jgi:hypothetical protein
MTLSYSGLTNYGKVTLPCVESWNMNTNITRDPPRSIMTRRIDKVGDTSAFAATLAASDDRFCEAINYYARGVNPMVSVSYGEGQSQMNTSANGAAFLPYRVVRDGAFRPPIWRQEDLLPLSRLPRNWTTVDARPFEVDYTKRLFDCGTAETTDQVKTNLLKIDCETRKTIAAYPELTAPVPRYMLKDPLAPGTESNRSAQYEIITERPPIVLAETRPNARGETNFTAINEIPIPIADKRLDRNNPLTHGMTNYMGINETPISIHDVRLARNHPMAKAQTNYAGINETPISIHDVRLARNHPMAKAQTNYAAIKETPNVMNNIRLDNNHPTTSRDTNPSGSIFNASISQSTFDRLPTRTALGQYESRPQLAVLTNVAPELKLVKVR